jgi:hypothetical protein
MASIVLPRPFIAVDQACIDRGPYQEDDDIFGISLDPIMVAAEQTTARGRPDRTCGNRAPPGVPSIPFFALFCSPGDGAVSSAID